MHVTKLEKIGENDSKISLYIKEVPHQFKERIIKHFGLDDDKTSYKTVVTNGEIDKFIEHQWKKNG